MINYNINFIGGIHGVGKTTFCKLLTERIGYLHYSASSLIKEYKKRNGKLTAKDLKEIKVLPSQGTIFKKFKVTNFSEVLKIIKTEIKK